MAPHSCTLAWKIPWMEEPGRLQSMGSQIVRHDWATSLPFSLSCIGEGNGNPLQCSCLENPRDDRAWWAAVCGVAQSRTRLKRLSSSSSSKFEIGSLKPCNFVLFQYCFHCFRSFQFSSVAVMSDSLRPHEPQHARPPCPPPTAGVYPNPCPL